MNVSSVIKVLSIVLFFLRPHSLLASSAQPPAAPTMKSTYHYPKNNVSILQPLVATTPNAPLAIPPKDMADKKIIAHIKTSIATNNDVSNVHISITSKNGKVALVGPVNNYVETNTLIIIVEATPGVKNIDVSQLRLMNSNTTLATDAVISAKIKGRYIREKIFTADSLTPIRVITFNGVVTLIGKVASKKHEMLAIEIAKSTAGVHKVKSEIILEGL